MTSYETIFNCFLRKINDVELARQIKFNRDFVLEEMTGWLHSSIAKLGLFEQEQITFDDENMQIEEDLTDWEIEIYALGVRVEWLEPLVKSRVNLSQMFGGKEEKYYSQASHISAITGILEDAKLEIRKMKRDFGYAHNSYIEERT